MPVFMSVFDPISGNLCGSTRIPSITDSLFHSSALFEPLPKPVFMPRVPTWVENNTGPLLPAIKDPEEINYMKPNAHLSRATKPALLGTDTRPTGYFHRWDEDEKRSYLGGKPEREVELLFCSRKKAETKSAFILAQLSRPTVPEIPPEPWMPRQDPVLQARVNAAVAKMNKGLEIKYDPEQFKSRAPATDVDAILAAGERFKPKPHKIKFHPEQIMPKVPEIDLEAIMAASMRVKPKEPEIDWVKLAADIAQETPKVHEFRYDPDWLKPKSPEINIAAIMAEVEIKKPKMPEIDHLAIMATIREMNAAKIEKPIELVFNPVIPRQPDNDTPLWQRYLADGSLLEGIKGGETHVHDYNELGIGHVRLQGGNRYPFNNFNETVEAKMPDWMLNPPKPKKKEPRGFFETVGSLFGKEDD